MNNLIIDFANHTNDAIANFNLGIWYEQNGFTAAGLTFFLRSAEYSKDDNLTYESLLRGFFCYKKQGSRDDSAQILLQNAVAAFPKRPESYFLLSRFYEEHKKWQESYIYACLGIELAQHENLSNLLTDVEYPGKYGLIFQKAVAGYWWGKEQECRKLFQELIHNYDLAEPFKSKVVNNIMLLGSGSKETVFREYTKDQFNKLNFKFPGCEMIKNNFSQAYQDMFALFISQGKKQGTYLEIGSGDPKWLNNTYLLESLFGWKGIGIEYNAKLVDQYKSERKNLIICQDAHTVDYEKILKDTFGDEFVIDYLQLDCEPSESTYNLLLKIPFEKYKFKAITFEHDHYIDMSKTYRDLSRKFLTAKGYELVLSNVSSTDWAPFEDWWVHPDLVDRTIIDQIKNTDDNTKKIDDYFISNTKIETKTMNKFSIKDSKPTAIIVDNFYENPDSVREFALSQSFMDGGIGKGYIGKRTYEQFLFPGLKEKFESILGHQISSWEKQPMNGRFQLTFAGEPLVYHCDSQKWAAMIYLTPHPPFECGTTLYAHKKTRARSYYDEGWDYSWKDPNLGDLHLDGTFFEPVDVLGNVYNRLVIFDGSNIHSASKYFGQIDTNARLWHMFFFD